VIVTVNAPFDSITAAGSAVAAIARGQQAAGDGRFARAMAAAQTRADEARAAAEQMVGMALFLPLLKMARNDPLRTDLFHAGLGEDMIGGQIDQLIADRMSQRANLPLIDAVYERFAAGDGPAGKGTGVNSIG
jgi:hypothetical protein